MKKYLRLWVISGFAFISLGFGIPLMAQNDLQTYKLVVKLNGKQIIGLQHILLQLNGSQQQDADKADALMQANATPLKKGSISKLAVYIVGEGGQLTEVTSNQGLTVEATLEQLQFSKGQLIATPSNKMKGISVPGPVMLFVSYAPNGKGGRYGLDEFYIELVD
jgi:hypothetical protein